MAEEALGARVPVDDPPRQIGHDHRIEHMLDGPGMPAKDLLQARSIGHVSKAPNPTDDGSPDRVRLRVAFEHAAILELQPVVALRLRMSVEIPHLFDESLRIFQLIEDEREGLIVVARRQNAIGDAPHLDELSVVVDDLLLPVDHQNAVRRRFERGAQQRKGPIDLLLDPRAFGHVPKTPDSSGGSGNRVLRRREPLEDTAIFELQNVVALLAGLGINAHRPRHEPARVLQLIEHVGQSPAVITGGRDLVGDPPHLDEPPVVRDDVAAVVHDQNAVGRGIQGRPQKSERSLQLSFGAFALGDVQSHTDDADDIAGGVAERFQMSRECAPHPIAFVEDRLPRQRPAVGSDGTKRLVLGVEKLEERQPNGPIGIGDEPGEPSHPARQPEIAVGRPEQRGHLLDEQTGQGLPFACRIQIRSGVAHRVITWFEEDLTARDD